MFPLFLHSEKEYKVQGNNEIVKPNLHTAEAGKTNQQKPLGLGEEEI